MLKQVLTVVLGLSIVSLTGCARLRELEDQNATLLARVQVLDGANQELETTKARNEKEIAGLRDEVAQRDTKLREYQGMVESLEARQRKLEENRKRLEKLAKDLGDFVRLIERGESSFIAMESEILFGSGKHELLPDAKKGLDEIARYLQANRALKIRIDGHTDGEPIRASGYEDNWHLACMRALAVRRYLASKGVAAERMFVAGFGPSVPLVAPPNPTAAVEENRRVEILIRPETPEGGVGAAVTP